MKILEEKFKNAHTLPREERLKLHQDLTRLKPDFLEGIGPRWWWWRRCKIKVLVVVDGLNFGFGGFGLSEFLTAFNELEAQHHVNYELTLADRGPGLPPLNNPVAVDAKNNFKFDAPGIDLNNFDQIWLFGIQGSSQPTPDSNIPNQESITSSEISAIENYMNSGGGLFATGDHGVLGNVMCGNIPRVKDMRYWNDFPNSSNDENEVSMGGKKRNDTNQPPPGQVSSNAFNHQSDNIPQKIAVRTFGNNASPHPLLSVNTNVRQSGIIDIMPDHPHEGECKAESSFTVNGVSVSSQIIATSFVIGGNTAGFKDPTDPHCFPSIAVWDGWLANAGRIVVDSTWHHFVNINVNGLTNTDWDAICHYFMNIAKWMSRRRYWWCWRRRLIFELLHDSQIIEASLDNPKIPFEEIGISEIRSIGALAKQELANRIGESGAKAFLFELIEEVNPKFANFINPWNPISSVIEKGKKRKSELKSDKRLKDNWIDFDSVFLTTIGTAFLELRDDKIIGSIENITEKSLHRIDKLFVKGIEKGFELSIQNLEQKYNRSMKLIL